MANASRAISLYAVRLRVGRLAASGAPLVGADNLYVTDSLVKVTFTPTFSETDAVEKINGRGGSCLNLPARRRISGVDLAVEICDDDPALYELLAGGSVLTGGAGADIIGYQLPKSTDPNENGVSLEVWTEAYAGSGLAKDLPYFRYLFPRANLSLTERSLGAELDEKSFEGTGTENNSLGTGPEKDWTHDSGAAMQFIRTTTAPPAATNAYAAIVA